MSTFYLTTPIFYVNGAPHIGHAYTAIIADIFARHYRQRGKDVFFLTGTDEHGLKIQRSAEAQGMTPQQLADKNSATFHNLFSKMDITYDRFIRTTDDDHKRAVVEMVKRLCDAGYIYEASYEGWYAASDEAFVDDSEVEDGISLISGAKVEWIKEPSFFFKLSAFQDRLLQWFDEDPSRIQPAGRFKEIRSFVEGGLKDLSITRTTFEWGIPFPDNPKHIIYVWIDALTNYLTGVGGFEDSKMRQKYWPCQLHLIGKDILRFHTVYWPAFLMAIDYPLPQQIFAHGWWLNNGEKMSKSRNNFIDAFELIEKYDLDLLRYYLVREIPLGSDGNFSDARIAQRNNSELADNLGNLANRTFAMTAKFTDSKIPQCTNFSTLSEDRKLADRCRAVVSQFNLLMDARNTADAMELIMSLSSDLNHYCAVTQPWALHKKADFDRLAIVLNYLNTGLAFVAVLAKAFMPTVSQKILDALGLPEFDQISELSWDILQPGFTIVSPGVLFEKFDMKQFEESKPETEQPKSPKGKAPKKTNKSNKLADSNDDQATSLINFDDFLKVDLRCGKIVAAEKVDGAAKLLKLKVDVGESEARQIVAGIAKSYQPDDIVGLHVAVVTNLKTAKIFGIESRGMLLAVDTSDGGLCLTIYPESVAPGTRIS